MEIAFPIVLWGVRLLFLLLLYLFLFRAFAAVHWAMRADAIGPQRPAAGLAYLVVERGHPAGPRTGDRLPLHAVSAIGRGARNDIVLGDEAASARHAAISLIDGEWWVEDSGSTNGTHLNGTRIGQRERLRPGDVLAIGRVSLRFQSA
ncbi:MAG: FHA domain-containing protein [Chloroflexota bacterium]|nr:FHA domain-containing protein [Chloroflexota bacterium]